MTLKEGPINLQASYIGFKEWNKQIELKENLNFEITLASHEFHQEIIVTDTLNLELPVFLWFDAN